MSNTILNASTNLVDAASATTNSSADFAEMYRSVTAHEFNLLRPKEVPLLVVSPAAGAILDDGCNGNRTPTVLVPLGGEGGEEASKALPFSSSTVDFSKIGEYQHENLSVNIINHQINNSITAAIPPPPPPLPTPTHHAMASTPVASFVNDTVNASLNASADTTLVNDIDTEEEGDNIDLSNTWNRYGQAPPPIYGTIHTSVGALKQHLINNSIGANETGVQQVPALTLNPLTNLPVRAYGSDIQWEGSGPIPPPLPPPQLIQPQPHPPTFTNMWPMQQQQHPALTLNPATRMPLVKPNEAPPTMTMRSLVPLPVSMTAIAPTSPSIGSSLVWPNQNNNAPPPNTPVNFNGMPLQQQQQQQQQQWNFWNPNRWNHQHLANNPAPLPRLPLNQSHVQSAQTLKPPALTWNSTPLMQNHHFQYQHAPLGYGYNNNNNNNQYMHMNLSAHLDAQRLAPHLTGHFHQIAQQTFAPAPTLTPANASQAMSHSLSAWHPGTSRAAQLYGLATRAWQQTSQNHSVSVSSNMISGHFATTNALPPPGHTLPSKYVVVSSQNQAPTKSSLVKRSSPSNTTPTNSNSPANNNNNNSARSVTFQEQVVNIDEENIDVEEKAGTILQHELTSVPVNVDPNPEIINKPNAQTVNYTQNVSLKFLKPPSPPAPGDITVRQEPDVQAPPLSPILIQQNPKSPPPVKPPARVIRERPPIPPPAIPPLTVTLPGRVLPPPPRKVIVEKLPQLPTPPSDVTVERWLGYNKRTRRIKYEPAPKLVLAPKPRNVLIEWDKPKSIVEKGYTFLGVIECDPSEYVRRYGPELAAPQDLPPIAYEANFKPPLSETFAINYRPDVPRLVGDVEALRLLNLNPSAINCNQDLQLLLRQHMSANLPAITAY
jgi:hypothetical protein